MSIGSETKPNILEYQDLRVYLKDWVEFKKKENPHFSLTQLSKKAGFASNAYLANVFSGSRKFTSKVFDRIAPYLGLDSVELAYLDLLRSSSEAKQVEDRQNAMMRLSKFTSHYKKEIKEIEEYEYLNHWYYVAIREMAELPDFQLDPVWISRRLKKPVEIEKIQEAIERLKSFGFFGEDGKFNEKGRQDDLFCQEGLYRLSLAQFYQEIFRLAEESIKTTSRDKRDIQGLSICISKKQYRQIQERTRSYLSETLDIVRSERPTKASEIYQLSLALFPLTSTKGEK